jgi:hypothetical protein
MNKRIIAVVAGVTLSMTPLAAVAQPASTSLPGSAQTTPLEGQQPPADDEETSSPICEMLESISDQSGEDSGTPGEGTGTPGQNDETSDNSLELALEFFHCDDEGDNQGDDESTNQP